MPGAGDNRAYLSALDQRRLGENRPATRGATAGRYFYAVFMCHLSIEKALKGLYYKVLDEVPPKTHNLLYLLNKIGKKPEPKLEKFIIKLNTASVATRYPDDLAKIQGAYTD
ncbi:HEPN domain-containing protein [Desulfoglaeba alkanexedens]|nr:HEPN domain-containing protein [Desulfoglaeba alkanexedens]